MNRDTAKDGYLREVMSMHHSHDNIGKLIPQVACLSVLAVWNRCLGLVCVVSGI